MKTVVLSLLFVDR